MFPKQSFSCGWGSYLFCIELILRARSPALVIIQYASPSRPQAQAWHCYRACRALYRECRSKQLLA